MALRGLYQEAIAEDDKALQKVLKGYEETLANDPTNMVLPMPSVQTEPC